MTSVLKSIATSKRFEHFILTIIMAACVLVGVQSYELSSPAIREMMPTLDLIDSVILWIFVAEVGVKMGAEGSRPWRYFLDPWNVFDFSIVAVCFLPFAGSYAAVFRLLRLLRALRLIRALPRLQVLVMTLLNSLPGLLYVSLLLGLFFYIYACAAVFLFGQNDPVHFQHLPISMLSLFRVVTGEDWTDVMYIAMYGCAEYGYTSEMMTQVVGGETWSCAEHSQGRPFFGAMFFVSFMLLGAMIILNLFIGIILSGMEEADLELARSDLAASEPAVATRDDRLKALAARLEAVQKDLAELARGT